MWDLLEIKYDECKATIEESRKAMKIRFKGRIAHFKNRQENLVQLTTYSTSDTFHYCKSLCLDCLFRKNCNRTCDNTGSFSISLRLQNISVPKQQEVQLRSMPFFVYFYLSLLIQIKRHKNKITQIRLQYKVKSDKLMSSELNSVFKCAV